jgi:hypothetical protein
MFKNDDLRKFVSKRPIKIQLMSFYGKITFVFLNDVISEILLKFLSWNSQEI